MFQAKRILGQHTQTVRFTSDGRFCLTGERQCVSLWNPSRSDDYVYLELEEQALLISTYVNGYTHPITSLTSTETSTGKHLLIAGSNKTLLVTDMLTNQVQHKYYGTFVGK
jgi:WD40 repeat protein